MIRLEVPFGSKKLIFETGRVARQATSAVTVQLGDTVVLVSVVGEREPKPNAGFFPLLVEYRERTYAAGKIPGGFFKREGRPSEREILTSRLIDRPVRPLFPDGYLCDVQITATVLSADGENCPDIPAVLGAAFALHTSDIPIQGPFAACRVGRLAGTWVLNPTFQEIEQSDMDVIVAATRERVVMIESGLKEVSEADFLEAVRFAHRSLATLFDAAEQMARQAGRKKRSYTPSRIPQDVLDKVRTAVAGKFEAMHLLPTREERMAAHDKLVEEATARFDQTAAGFDANQVEAALEELEKKEVRELILSKKARPDGRGFNDLRPIECQVGVLPRTHGSALFTRGQTQSLSTVTLGTAEDEQRIDALEGESSKRFMLHYNFPNFSVGEIGPSRGPGRREIGHGALAERSLRLMMPGETEFPYTVRVVSDILESNGSSSMATVCAATLALMDAGVPQKSPVAGIAIGLVSERDRWETLTDIAGIEDHLGDMDFKVAGTSSGMTAVQMDVKIAGITFEMMERALAQAREARAKILEIMMRALDKPRAELSVYAPRITQIKINPAKIREVIGPGGKIIRRLIEETGVRSIDIEDDGSVSIASTDPAAAQRALDQILAITAEAEIGKIYEGTVVRILNFGAFVEIMPGTDGLIHISELADGFVKSVEDVVRIGDVVPVKVMEIDEQGRVNLSRKQALLDRGESAAPPPPRERGPEEAAVGAGDRGPGRSGGRDFGRRGGGFRDRGRGGPDRGRGGPGRGRGGFGGPGRGGSDRGPARSHDRGPERGPERSPEPGPERGPERSDDRGPERSPDRGPEHSPDRGPERSPDQAPERSPERSRDRGPERSPERSRDRGPERNPERSRDRGPERSPEPAQGPVHIERDEFPVDDD